jgi:hypothetical protein
VRDEDEAAGRGLRPGAVGAVELAASGALLTTLLLAF